MGDSRRSRFEIAFASGTRRDAPARAARSSPPAQILQRRGDSGRLQWPLRLPAGIRSEATSRRRRSDSNRESAGLLAVGSESAHARESGVFQGLGFDPAAWELLRDALLVIAQAEDLDPGQASEFGAKYEIRATIAGPTGRRALIRTVWIVNVGEDRPRFITAFPD